MARWAKHALGIFGVLSTAACTGSGCCSGTSVLDPLPKGFDNASRVENGAAMRVSRAGFDFVQANIAAITTTLLATNTTVDNGVLRFPIPTTTLQGTGYDLVLCPDGPVPSTGTCIGEVDLLAPDRTFTTALPHHLLASGTIPVRVKNLPIRGTVLGAPVEVQAVLSNGGDTDCNTTTMAFKKIGLDARISVEAERDPNHALREGYSRIQVEHLGIDETQTTAAVHACGGTLAADVINALKGALVPAMMAGFEGRITTTIQQEFCEKAKPAATVPCPVGTSEQDGLCWYPDSSCASAVMGLDGRVKLGGLLSSFSPGSRGGMDFVIAMGGSSPRPEDATLRFGDLNPVANGATIGMYGGALPSPAAACVKPVQLTAPLAIPIPADLLADAPAGWTGDPPHAGIAISQTFANYFLGNAYNAGALCLGISTDQVAQLSTSLFGLIIPSVKLLAHQKQNAPILLQLRPQLPPTITVGTGANLQTDPILRIKLDQVVVDFYVWSSGRFIRAFSLQGDLDVPLGLEASAEGLLPLLDKIVVANPVVTNSFLMRESPPQIAAGLADAISGLAGQFLGGIKPFDIAGIAAPIGLGMQIEAQGVRQLTQGTESYLGVFAKLTLPTTTPATAANTTATLVHKNAAAEGFRLETHTAANAPKVTVRAASTHPSGANAEYSYRLDAGLWHPWSPNREILVDDPYLMLQGRHAVAVRSRLAGQPSTVDRSPAVVEFILDATDPEVRLSAQENRATRIDAQDNVSLPGLLQERHRFDGNAWTEWTPMAASAQVASSQQATSLEVEVRDEEGNVALTRRILEGAGARGQVRSKDRVPPAGGSIGEDLGIPPLAYVGLGALALSFVLMQRKRKAPQAFRRSIALASVGFVGLAMAGTWSGCNCTDDIDAEEEGTQLNNDAGATGACGTPGASDCIVLKPGLIGSYTSSATAADGTLWVAGYNEADWDGDVTYGDLVVGAWDGNAVKWKSVDGVPASPAPDPAYYDLTSWRGGQDVAGDDVGMWTSLALDASGKPRVAYFDATHGALKFAAYDGAAWTVSTVYGKAGETAGRFAKLVIVKDKPVIAFQVVEASKGGFARSRLVLASASSASPAAGDWNFEDVTVDDQSPCRASLCPKDTLCVQSTAECVVPETTCDPKCPSGQGCVAGVCVPVFDTTKLDTIPPAIASGIAMAPVAGGNVGLVFYDRVHGNLMQATKEGSTWTTRVVDGELAGTPALDTGNAGASPSLFVDAAGTWHVAYGDANQRTLRYVAIANGTTIGTPETVDDGSAVGGVAFEDAWHAVGDDANVSATDSGEVRIAYQDATAGKLRWAVGTASASGHDWATKVVDQGGFAGFFSQQVQVGGTTKVVNWWRQGGAAIEGGVRVVSP